jgi:hypothetical protein
MEKIKIVFYSHTIDFAGTWRSHERILLNLNKDKFEPYVLYRPNADNNRLEYVINKLGSEYVIPFDASKEKTGPQQGYSFITNNFKQVVDRISPHIIHFARGGYYEWPFIERIAPVQVETNIFGGKDNTEFLDCSVTICNTITKLRGKSDYEIYNPIPLPIENNKNLRQELNIDDDCLVFGRVGRKDNFHPIALNSMKRLKDIGVKFKYLILGCCTDAIKTIQNLGLTNECIILEPTNDDYYIHKFHNTIDIFAHYRRDGECHSTAIAQALMYGIPVISHYAGYNGQSETISNGGYVANNETDYVEFILRLINSKDFYTEISKNAKVRALDFEEKKIVSKFEELYIKLINDKIK